MKTRYSITTAFNLLHDLGATNGAGATITLSEWLHVYLDVAPVEGRYSIDVRLEEIVELPMLSSQVPQTEVLFSFKAPSLCEALTLLREHLESKYPGRPFTLEDVVVRNRNFAGAVWPYPDKVPKINPIIAYFQRRLGKADRLMADFVRETVMRSFYKPSAYSWTLAELRLWFSTDVLETVYVTVHPLYPGYKANIDDRLRYPWRNFDFLAKDPEELAAQVARYFSRHYAYSLERLVVFLGFTPDLDNSPGAVIVSSK